MFKKLFANLKFKLMGELINKLLAPIVQAFKLKSPKIFGVFVIVATVLQFGLGSVLGTVIPGLDLPPDLLSLTWIIDTFGLKVDANVPHAILWFLALLTGSQSTAWLPQSKRDEVVADSKMNAKIVDVTRTEDPAVNKAKTIESLKAEKRRLRAERRANK